MPYVFFGDHYGIYANNIDQLNDQLDKLLEVRLNFTYGELHDYYNKTTIVGWIRKKGLDALISITHNNGSKKFVGEKFSDKTFRNISGEIKIAEDGNGDFTVNWYSY